MERDGLGRDEHRENPRKVDRREVVATLNRARVALNFVEAEISAAFHLLGVADRLEVQRRAAEEPE